MVTGRWSRKIITALSCIRWLFVIARNSSFTYKDQAVDVKQVGRGLGVRYVLEGSVRVGHRKRIQSPRDSGSLWMKVGEHVTDVGRYSFIAVDLHHLLLAGLPAHLCENTGIQSARRKSFLISSV